MASPYTEVVFTKGEGTPERTYIKTKDTIKLVTMPGYAGTNTPDRAFDGDASTFWESLYSREGFVQDQDGNWIPNHRYEFISDLGREYYLSGISYVPSGTDGAIRGIKVYVSTDGAQWSLAGETSDWIPNTEEKRLDFSMPAYARYVKLETTRAGVKNFMDMTAGYATAAEFRFYENYVIEQAEIDSISISADGMKKDYKVGDKLDTENMSVIVTYKDGRTSLLPASAASLSEDILTDIAVTRVTAEYKGYIAGIDIMVSENDRTASAIAEVITKDKKYYAGDTVDKSDVTVIVTDGTEKWYLGQTEFETSGTLTEGKSEITVTHSGLSKAVQITAGKRAAGISVKIPEIFKTQYSIGDALDLSELLVTLTNADGSMNRLAAGEYDISVINGDVTERTEEFSKTSGSKLIRVSVKDKPEIYDDISVTVLPYITSGAYSFEAEDGSTECTLTAYDAETGGAAADIPRTVEVGGVTYTVTAIAGGAFKTAENLVSVKIPETVKKIEQGAFSECTQLKTVYLTDYSGFDSFACEPGAFPAATGGVAYMKDGVSGEPVPGYTHRPISKDVKAIELTTPIVTEYVLGDTLDLSGMSVTAILNDGSRAEISDCSIAGFNNTAAGRQTVTVTLNGTTLSKTFEVNVSFPKITITRNPKSAVYTNAQSIQPLEVKADAGKTETLYRWYKAADVADRNGTLIQAAEKSSYTPKESGFYYAEVFVRDSSGRESDPVYSETAEISVNDYAAMIGAAGYMSLEEAVSAAPEAVQTEITLLKDVQISDKIEITNKKLAISGGGFKITRGAGYKLQMFDISEKSELTLKKIALDGGAVWSGDPDSVLGRGTKNTGITAGAPLIITAPGTKLTIGEDAVLENNDNPSLIKVYGATCVGGAVCAISANVVVNGGKIANNSSGYFGGAAYLRGTSRLDVISGEISGNRANKSAAICLDNSAEAAVDDGIFKNNYGGDNGGVFWISQGRLTLNNGEFTGNKAAQKGGVAYFNASGASLAVNGGTYSGNSAGTDGGVIYINKSVSFMGGKFDNNSAVGSGGAVYMNGALTLSGTRFSGNTAAKGDGIYMASAAAATLTNIEKMDEIYYTAFKPITIYGGIKEGGLTITTGTETEAGTIIVELAADYSFPVSVNGKKAVKEKDPKLGYIMRLIDMSKARLSYINGTVKAENITEACTLIFASYRNGELLDVKLFDISRDTEKSVAETGLNTDRADSVKAMLWRDVKNIIPMDGSVECE